MGQTLFLKSTLLLFTFFSGASFCFAASVTKVSAKKKQIMIDEGTDAGVTVGATFCVFNDSDQEIACGSVTKVKKDKSMVKFKNKKELKKIKKGMMARLQDLKIDSGSSSGLATYRTNFKLQFIPAFLPPAEFQKLSFNPVVEGQGARESNWQQNGSSAAFLSFGGEGEIGLGTSMSIAFGARYRLYCGLDGSNIRCGYVIESDSLVNAQNQAKNQFYYSSETKGTAIGFWVDFYFFDLSFSENKFVWRFATGLDIDRSTVEFTATKKDDTGAQQDIITDQGVSTLNTFSLRLPMPLTFFIDPIGINFGPTLLIPIFANQSFSYKSDDSSYTGATFDAAEEDLQISLNHKKAGFGVELLLSAFFAF